MVIQARAFGNGAALLAIDEELSLLEDQLRRLKMEYDMYFGGGSKKPPAEIEWKVKNLLKKFSDGNRMNYAQRFRYTTIQQRYALYNALWQQKLVIKEEGYRRPQDAVLGIQGLRTDEEHEAQKAMKHHGPVAEDRPFSMSFSEGSDPGPRGITVSGSHRRAQKDRRNQRRQPGLIQEIRETEDRAAAKRIWLSDRGIYRRTAERAGQAESQAEKLAVGRYLARHKNRSGILSHRPFIVKAEAK